MKLYELIQEAAAGDNLVHNQHVNKPAKTYSGPHILKWRIPYIGYPEETQIPIERATINIGPLMFRAIDIGLIYWSLPHSARPRNITERK